MTHLKGIAGGFDRVVVGAKLIFISKSLFVLVGDFARPQGVHDDGFIHAFVHLVALSEAVFEKRFRILNIVGRYTSWIFLFLSYIEMYVSFFFLHVLFLQLKFTQGEGEVLDEDLGDDS